MRDDVYFDAVNPRQQEFSGFPAASARATTFSSIELAQILQGLAARARSGVLSAPPIHVRMHIREVIVRLPRTTAGPPWLE